MIATRKKIYSDTIAGGRKRLKRFLEKQRVKMWAAFN
jgi:hypothetical protein